MANTKRTLLLTVFFGLALACSSFFSGYQARAFWPPPSERYGLIKEAQHLLSEYYLGEMPTQLLLERGMVRGMVAVLEDPYTTYVEPSVHELQKDDLAGVYGGIGAYLSRDERGHYHLIPFDGSPADQAGVREGDLLLAVDGVPVGEDGLQDEVLAMIRGPVGTVVTLTLAPRREGGDPVTVRIERRSFALPSVTGYLAPADKDVGVIAITRFSERTSGEAREAFLDLRSRGADAFILDLRGNAGGLLDAAVDVARIFLKEGLVVVEKRRGSEEQRYRVDRPGEGAGVPLVALVDGGTASAAEVVAAAIQEHARAPLIGQPTFGKGSVQVVLELSDGSSLHVTTARWQTPSGDRLDERGLHPDLLVAQESVEYDAVMQTAINWLRESREAKR